LALPKGGGAIRGIGETFQPDLFTGTANFTLPLALSPGRRGFRPDLALSYSSGSGNGPFGLGWQLSLPRISRKTDKGLPKYDADDVFVMSGAEDLVRARKDGSRDVDRGEHGPVGGRFEVTRYRPRTSTESTPSRPRARKSTGSSCVPRESR
jgi:hypothetical protein